MNTSSTDQADHPKIFGIGLNKTGTTTLGQCGRILGLRCTSVDRDLLEDVVVRKDFTRIQQAVSDNDLFEDWPWPLIYKELDEMYPGSRFVLTTRKTGEKWLNSLKSHSMKTHPTKHCRKLAYGYNYPHKNEQAHLDFYRNHNEQVRSYFKGRENDFIEICWENGDGFEKLCSLLDCEVPDTEIPHANKKENFRPSRMRIYSNKIRSMIGS